MTLHIGDISIQSCHVLSLQGLQKGLRERLSELLLYRERGNTQVDLFLFEVVYAFPVDLASESWEQWGLSYCELVIRSKTHEGWNIVSHRLVSHELVDEGALVSFTVLKVSELVLVLLDHRHFLMLKLVFEAADVVVVLVVSFGEIQNI